MVRIYLKTNTLMSKHSLLMAIVLLFAGSLLAQRTVTGTVLDASSQPVSGASVLVRNEPGIGTVSGSTGTFSLVVPSSATELIITSIGFDSLVVDIANRTQVSATLTPVGTGLTTVVVTGYTTTSRKKFTGATVTLPVEDIRKQPFGSFDQALQGAGAGLSVVSNSGQPGSNAVVRIRGNGSLSGSNTPLYVMDGIEISAADFASINQGDFESVNILKDAVATSQYGSRGANGVIVITTRRGRAGQLQLNYDAQLGFSDLPENRLVVMNSRQKIDYELQRGNPYGWSDAEADSLRAVNFDWQDALFQTGMTHQHQISASGGNANTRMYGSLSYMDQEGIVKTTGLKRYTGRVNIDNTIKNWRFGIGLQGGFSKVQQTSENNAVTATPLNAIRWSNPYERDRDPNTGEYQETGGAGTGQLASGQPNGAMELFLNDNSDLQIKGLGTTYLEFHFPFLKGLYARTNWGVDYTQDELRNYGDRRTSSGQVATGSNGSLNRQLLRTFRYTGTTSLNYKQVFGDHDVEVGVFNEVVKATSNSFGFTGYGLTNGFTNEAGITAGSATGGYIPVVAGTGTMNGIQSFFTIINYGFKSKYYATLVGRRDGSSRFGVNNRYANFGSVGLNWILSEENFLSDVKFLDLLKFRASLGTNGNNGTSAGDFGQIPSLGRANYAGTNGFSLLTPGNLNYRWETNRTINLGVDFEVLARRITGSIDVYDRKTLDLFYDQPLDPTTAFGSLPGNIGSLRNRGIELNLNGDIVRTKSLRVFIGGNLTYNKNQITSLPEDSILTGTTILAVGKPIGTFFLVPYAGVNSANGNALYRKLDGSVTQVFNTDDRVMYGTSNSPLFGALNAGVSFKGFDLSAQATFFLRRVMFNNDRNNVINPTYYFDNMSVEMLREWTRPGDITDVPRPSSTGGNAYQDETSRLLEDADYWRLRNVTLGYTVPSSLMSRLKMRSARVFVQAVNWATETKFQSFDPEQSTSVLTGAQYPSLVQTTVGLSIGF